jgi:hypothetical protein
MREKLTIMGYKDRAMAAALMERMVQEYTTQVQVMESVVQSYEERLAKLIARPRSLSTTKSADKPVVPTSELKENVRVLTDKIRSQKSRLTLLNAKYSQKLVARELQERLAKSNDFIAMLVRETGAARAEVIVPVVRGYKDRIRYLEGENARLWGISRRS